MNNNRQPNYNPRAQQPPRAPGQRNAQNARPVQNNKAAQNPRTARKTVGQTPMSRINNQTPNQRRAEPKKIKLTAEQIEINRVNRQRERYYIKKRRAAMIRTFLARFVVFLFVFAILLAFSASAFYLNLTRTEATDSSSYSYQIGDKKYSLPYRDAVVDGRVYVSFTDVAEMCDLAVTGSEEDIKYVIKGDEAETIRFLTDTRVVYVNGVETRLGDESFYRNGRLYVPVDFVNAYFKGLNIDIDEKAHRVTIERQITNLGENGKLPKGEEAIYGELSFLLQAPAAIEAIVEEEVIEATMPDLGFLANLKIYEQYMNPGNTMDYLALVNVDNRLASNYVPQDLVVVENTRKDGRADQMLREYAAMALEALFKEMRAAGYEDVDVTSAYRSYAYQESLFNPTYQKYLNQGYSEQEALEKAMAESDRNPPGASEHQTGLCLDMHNIPTGASVAFGETDAFKWLKENCWKFGFILRYPEDKTEITQIDYEPWHYRYVGRYHAQRMHEMDLCLEEYWDLLQTQ